MKINPDSIILPELLKTKNPTFQRGFVCLFTYLF